MKKKSPSKQMKSISPLIVKVQVSLASSDGKRYVLVYNKARTFERQGPVSPEWLEIMENHPKRYFNAELLVENGQEEIAIINSVEDQDW